MGGGRLHGQDARVEEAAGQRDVRPRRVGVVAVGRGQG